MMTKKYFSCKEQIINDQYGVIREIAINVLRTNNDLHFLDDLVQEVCLILLTQENESIMTIYEQGDFKFYVARIITNQVLSSTSPFHKKYRKKILNLPIIDEEYNALADRIWVDIHHLLTKKQRNLVNLRFVYKLKVKEIAKINGISTRQVYKSLDKIKKYLKKKYK
jgi:RNA polymerase sigma factor (sigma-70 family)